MKYAAIALACLVPLAGCNKGPEIHEKNASIAQVVNAAQHAGVASDRFLHAGQWRVTGTMDEMNIPGMPASAQAEMKKMMGSRQNFSSEYCLSPEEARRPRGKFFTGKDSNHCTYDHFDMAGGKIDAVMRCQGQPSGTMTMTMNGTYAPDSYSSHMTMQVAGGREGGMSMKMHSEAHRIGECTGGDKVKVSVGGAG